MSQPGRRWFVGASGSFLVGALAAALCFGAAGCGGGGGSGSNEGTLGVGVVAEVSGAKYRLSGASFEVTGGAAPLTLMTSEGSAVTSLLTPPLTPGQYSIELLDGWALERQEASVFAPVAGATLTSPNPQMVSVIQGQIARIGFAFMAAGVPVDFTPAGAELDGSYD